MEQTASLERPMPLPWTGDDGWAPESPAAARRRLVTCALWLHLGYVGAAVLVAGVVRLAGEPLHPLAAVALMLCGCGLAVACVRRAQLSLDRFDRVRRLPLFRAPGAGQPH